MSIYYSHEVNIEKFKVTKTKDGFNLIVNNNKYHIWGIKSNRIYISAYVCDSSSKKDYSSVFNKYSFEKI